ncbi:MAG TPA: M20/M25/M40 family metallo-hydrolase, partial [Planctomycetota bacterium]|nr:M20/M25/M40 family metallo-hydrolase [Planctomycetota bacterium]
MTPDPFAPGVLIRRLAALMAADTTTGREDRGLDVLREVLIEAGGDVELVPVAPGRTNVLARFGASPRALFTTHVDTVPPYIPPTVDGDVVRGRGACDAKGQIVAQLAAIESLRAEGRDDVAWLGVVGEEADSLGAKATETPAWRARLPDVQVVLN